MSFYETDRAVSEYLLFHYGAPQDILPYEFGPREALDFPVRCVAECLDVQKLPRGARALDLGCAVGRSSFELARHCQEVIGIDFSARFIQAAGRLRQEGSIDFEFAREGALGSRATVTLPGGLDPHRVKFEQGNAEDLRPDLGEFDAVLMANLLDRLRSPQLCLGRLPALLRSGGQLILTSPYTWLEEYTPRENWLGGFERDGKEVTTLQTLQELLGLDFHFVRAKNLPFLIREHARKFQWSVAEATLWTRR